MHYQYLMEIFVISYPSKNSKFCLCTFPDIRYLDSLIGSPAGGHSVCDAGPQVRLKTCGILPYLVTCASNAFRW